MEIPTEDVDSASTLSLNYSWGFGLVPCGSQEMKAF